MLRSLNITWNQSASTEAFKRNCRRRYFFSIILFLFLFHDLKGQEVYQSIRRTDLYDFLDELANTHVITLNSVVKPYSRILIAEKLGEAEGKKDALSNRQKEELSFFLKDYNKELKPDHHFDKRRDFIYYKDTLFTFSLNPILGFSGYVNDTTSTYHRWVGGEAFAYVGKKLGFYASFRGSYESKRLADPTYLNLFPGAVYKTSDINEAGKYNDMRGGITYTGDWGSIGIIKDNIAWGDSYHSSNIISGRAPSFAHLRLHLHPLRWLDFHYVHGWLASDVVDSTNSYFKSPGYELVFLPKYLAANLVTVTPWKNLDISIGNSVIYSDKNIQPAYLVPFFFYRTMVHSQDETGGNLPGENSQVFFNISSRQVRNVHLYTSFFVDEISFADMFNEKSQSNFISGKIGVRVSNLAVDNLFLTAEYTRTNPMVYRHDVKALAFASNGYNLGHYLGDNAQEIFLSAAYKPIAKMSVEISYTIAQKGKEYSYTTSTGIVSGNPFIRSVYWQTSETGAKTQYQLINDCYVFAGIILSDHHGLDVYTQPYARQKRTTINIGANIGF